MYTYHVSWHVPLTGPIKLKFISLTPKKELPTNLFHCWHPNNLAVRMSTLGIEHFVFVKFSISLL